MNDQRMDLIWPNEKLSAGLRASWRKTPQVGMVGFVVGCLSPNHAAASTSSSENHNILLVKVDDDLCIPISEKGVKEYKTITSPPSARHLNAPKNNNNTIVDEKEEEGVEEVEDEEKAIIEKEKEETDGENQQESKDEQVTL